MLEEAAAQPAPVTQTATPAPAPKAEPVSVPSKAEQAKMSADDLNAAEDELLRAAYRKGDAERADKRETDEATAPQRNDKGQFEAKALAGQPAEKADAKSESKPEPKAADPKLAAKPPEKSAVDAPKHWNEAQKKAFATLDRDSQEAFAKESTELRQTVSRQGNVIKQHEPTLKIAHEHKDYFKPAGLTFDQGLDFVLTAHKNLDNPQTVRQAHAELTEALEKQHGISLRQSPAPQQQQDDDDDWADPQVKTLSDRLARQEQVMQKMLQEIQRREQTEKQRQVEQRNAELTSTVNQFADQNADFDQIPAELIEAQVHAARFQFPDASPQELLSKALEAARWQHDATRDSYADKRAEARTAQAQAARRATSLNVNGHPTGSDDMSEDDLLRVAYRRGNARAN
jgi:hypothetical protein